MKQINNKLFKDITFKDDSNNIYTPYISLENIYLADINENDNFYIKIGNQKFKYEDYKVSFSLISNKLYLNLTSLLEFKEPLSNPHILNIELIKNGKSQFINVLYLTNYKLIKNNEINHYNYSLKINNLDYFFNYDKKETYTIKLTIDNILINVTIK